MLKQDIDEYREMNNIQESQPRLPDQGVLSLGQPTVA